MSKSKTKLNSTLLLEPVFPEGSELRTETMAGSFPSDSLGLGLASIGSPGDVVVMVIRVVMVVFMIAMVVILMRGMGYSQLLS